jgi:hypothetical protein
VRYVELPDDNSRKMGWNAVEVIWRIQVVSVENLEALHHDAREL